MSAPKFTPGPWAIGFADGSGRGGDNEGVYITAGDHLAQPNADTIVVRGGQDDYMLPVGVRNAADAALIAAAPELYAALREMWEAYLPQPQGGISQHVIDRRDAARTLARAALAKVSA